MARDLHLSSAVTCPAAPPRPIHAALPRRWPGPPVHLPGFVPLTADGVSNLIGRSIAARPDESLEHDTALMGKRVREAKVQPD